MASKDLRVDAYIARSAAFATPILSHLRKLVHANCPQATETLKWGMPHFEYKGGIFCRMAAFKAHCTFGFWLGALLKIESKLDQAMGQFGRITAIADLPSDKQIAAIIKAAMKLHDEGAKLPSRNMPGEKKELVVPAYFLAALKKKQTGIRCIRQFQYVEQKGIRGMDNRGQNRRYASEAPRPGGGMDE